MQTIDFNRSYFRFRVDRQTATTVTHVMPTAVNNVRINLECCCELIDRRTAKSHVYVLGASCETERVGPDRDIWLEPNADFCLATSDEQFLVFKSWARNGMAVSKHPEAQGTPQERQSGPCRDAWTHFGSQLRRVPGRPLEDIDEIIEAIRGDRAIVAHTEYDDGDYHVGIDHPVKTINYSEREQVYQTDTGPVLLPDLSAERMRRSERLVDCLDLAYAAFNSVGWAEFIVNVPTPVGEGISVNHYSQSRRIEPVRNVLIEVLDEVRPLHLVSGDRAWRGDAAEANVLGT